VSHAIAMLIAFLFGMSLTSAVAVARPSGPAPAKEPSATPDFTLSPGAAAAAQPFTGDLDGMIKRRAIRVLVPYSKTFYFVDRAVQRGLNYDVTRLLERDLNNKLKTGNIRVHVVCIPVNRGEMIPYLLEGRGDIAMGNLTITEERSAPSRSRPRRIWPGRKSTFASPRATTRASRSSTGSWPRRARPR
jgi:ABC-type amino acid transport substrate-binding protein